MKIVRLPSYSYEGNNYKNVVVFLDSEGRLILLPTLFALSARVNLVSYKTYLVENSNGDIETRVNEGDLSDATLDTYLPAINKYLSYLQDIDQSKSSGPPSILHGTSHATSNFVNYYINNELAPTVNNRSTMNVHISALTCFYMWMWNAGLCKRLTLELKTSVKKAIAGRTGGQNKVSYISRMGRELLKKEANKTSIRDYLLMEMGWTIGLRSKENQGLLLNDFNVGNKRCAGLKTLIAQMKSSKDKSSFQYHLGSKFTKGGKSRQIYFTRVLLKLIERYINGERDTYIERGKKIAEKREYKRLSRLNNGLETSNSIITFKEHDTLFINMDNANAGKSISKGCASGVFRKLLIKVPQLNQKLSYQDGRHTFATELYHSMKQKKGSVNASLLEVAIRLGHALKNGLPQEVTTRYIRLHDVMIAQEAAL